MKKLLKHLVKIKVIRMIDFIFSQFICTKNNIIMLIAACVSFESNNGYIFLPVEYFEKSNFFSINNKKIIKKILSILDKKINWSLELINHHAISDGNTITPLVFFQKKIYLYKIWKAEENILKCLNEKKSKDLLNLTMNCNLLQKLFHNNEEYSDQKVAVALSLINQITFILGAPGTGKSTVIIKIIIVLIKNAKKNIRIQLSAPTGKATSRLIEILNDYKTLNLYLSYEEISLFILKPITIHQLLGISEISDNIFFNKKNILNIDILIVDEVSMIDILTMNHILSSIQKNTKIIFIGDHNQLSPIGIGSILKKIYNYSHNGYSLETISILKKITQYSNLYNKENKNNTSSISDKICILQKNYRFQKNSSIHILSHTIYQNNKKFLNKLFNNLIENISFYEIKSDIQYIKMINKIIFYNTEYWEKIKKKANIEKIIKVFRKHQVLCITRNGPFGINGINNILERIMYKKSIFKKYFYIKNQIWYIGKPIMINKNNKYLDLCNGDIGITKVNHQKNLEVCFLKNQKIKCIPIDLLEHYETAWCITVHKSQGSEFNHTTLILPEKNLEILNKELLYTAITRSRKKLSIFSNQDIFMTTALKNNKTFN